MRILLVDDEVVGRNFLAKHLEKHLGHHVTQCDNGQQALRMFDGEYYPLVLTDMRMPGIDGIELLKQIKQHPDGRLADTVLITQYGDMSTVLAALRAGAYDYLTKPIDLEELAATVNRVVEHQALMKENFELTHQFEEKVAEVTHETKSQLDQLQSAFAQIVGIGGVGIFSDAMREVVAMALKLHQDRSIPVLIEGETGTGKEIIARMIHYGNKSLIAPFIAINCTAIPPHLFESELFGYEEGAFTGASRKGAKGKFELAQGGTVFLDEIGDMPLELQPKLLRVLQEREFYRIGGLKKIKLDVRVIGASNQEINRLLESGGFRKDLFYRFDIGRIRLLPLRERKEEIGPLARMFLRSIASQKKSRLASIHPESLRILESFPWPGNVRQLQNTIERVVLTAEDVEIRPGHLAFLTREGERPATGGALLEGAVDSIVLRLSAGGMDLKEVEKRIVERVLASFAGNKSRTAAYFNITRNSLRRKLQEP